MAKLSDILNTMLGEIVQARMETDKLSATIARAYLKDEILRNFDVPRIDIAELSIELKIAFDKPPGKDSGSALDVIIESARLREIEPSKVTTIRMVANLKNYEWNEQQPGSNTRTLIEKT
jgi:hypothetical protein